MIAILLIKASTQKSRFISRKSMLCRKWAGLEADAVVGTMLLISCWLKIIFYWTEKHRINGEYEHSCLLLNICDFDF